MNHYENVDAVQLGAPAAQINESNVAQIVNLQPNNGNRPHPSMQQYHPQYRNDVYDRTGGYDIPRNVRNQILPNGQRRSNLHLDIRPRSINQQNQRSFDDTESCYYGSNNGYNMYEHVRDEPLYQNTTNNPMYGRLDVIGHGIGRIERHLSSSCGNIDHYNVGGHYAVLSHSHINSMMVNQNQISASSSQNSRDGVKSLFSCLGGENSQSMNSINDNEISASQSQPLNNPAPQQRSTGAIPKVIKNKQNNKVSPKPNTTGAVTATPPAIINPTISQPIQKNFSKSSLQYLLMNKWLPLGPDYKIIDFNFMFSRNCSSSEHCNERGHEGVVQFNGQAEMVEPEMYYGPQREYPMMNNGQYPRIIRNSQLARLNECETEHQQRGNSIRARSESPNLNGQQAPQEDPFRNWSFNFDNNSFKPSNASQPQQQQIQSQRETIKDSKEQNLQKKLSVAGAEQDLNQPSTSKSTSPSTSDNSSSSSSAITGKTGEMKKSENYENLASLQQDPLPSSSNSNGELCKKKSTESISSDSVTLAEEDEDDNNDNDPFDLESDID